LIRLTAVVELDDAVRRPVKAPLLPQNAARTGAGFKMSGSGKAIGLAVTASVAPAKITAATTARRRSRVRVREWVWVRIVPLP
jgi:hypothetical protein